MSQDTSEKFKHIKVLKKIYKYMWDKIIYIHTNTHTGASSISPRTRTPGRKKSKIQVDWHKILMSGTRGLLQ